MINRNLDSALLILVFLACIGIPINDQFSTACLGALTAVMIWAFASRSGKWTEFKSQVQNNRWLILMPTLLLLLRVIPLVRPDIGWSEAQYATRALPFFWLPLLFVGLYALLPKQPIEDLVFRGLVYGCIAAFLVCEITLLYEWFSNGEPLEYIFRWRHLNIQFTEVIGVHPPYLGYLTLIAIFWLYQRKPRFYRVGLVMLGIFLLQLLARNAILALSVVLVFFILKERRYKLGLGLVCTCFLILAIAWFHPSAYLKSKINTMLVFNKPNNRFSRLEASYQTFLENPFFGGGKEFAEAKRVQYYVLSEDVRAASQKLNAHNQYMEYLSLYGLSGFLIFMTVIFWALLLAFRSTQPTFYGLVLAAFLFANLTESMLERSLGIKTFGLILALLIYDRLRGPAFNKPLGNSQKRS